MDDDTPPNKPARLPEYGAQLMDERSQPPVGSGMPEGAPFQSQFHGWSQQPRADTSRPRSGAAPYNISFQQAHGGSFNLGSLASALPDYGTSHPSIRDQQSVSSALRGPQYSGVSPFAGQQSSGQYLGTSIETPLDSTTGQQAHRLGHVGGGPSSFLTYGQPMPQYYYPDTQFNPQGQQQPFYAGGGHNFQPFGRSTSIGSGQGVQAEYTGNFQGAGLGRSMAGLGGYGEIYTSGEPALQRPPSSSGSLSSVPRGPPRKPKQSGHALWVGNLPPQTTVLDLKDHFSRDATKDIESLFLIAKSNCAFVNYRSEASCAAAMQRFHDSRFLNVRLVCRLRRGSAPPTGVPSGPAAMSNTSHASTSSPSSSQGPLITSDSADPVAQERTEGGDSGAAEQLSQEKPRDRFFIVKSLTLQDLNLSVRNGIWATQSHNEEALNKAYESAENVYLIFSANKSGEYFGYARMISAISEDAKQVLGTIPRHEPVTETADALRTIPTPATETAPKGHIIDDSARGTIFWEADHSDEEPEEETKAAVEGEDEGPSGPQSWGKPFKIEWLSTNRLPFYRTRGLRNPWNANREVKIARDGTELEPGVGNRLIQMFHRMGQPPGPQMPQMAMPGMPSPMGGPSMRPF